MQVIAEPLDFVPEEDLEPPHPWRDVPAHDWRSWRWQLSHRLDSVEQLEQVIHLTPEERAALSSTHRLRVDVTPYFASLMDPDDPHCPIRRQVIPTAAELAPFEAEMADSLAEEEQSPVPGLVHRYPDRVLMLVTTQCASYCRYCTRSRLVGDAHVAFNHTIYSLQLELIAIASEIRDVLVSGGDPSCSPPGYWRASCGVARLPPRR
jgi:lysine 2,3-aminomutase